MDEIVDKEWVERTDFDMKMLLKIPSASKMCKEDEWGKTKQNNGTHKKKWRIKTNSVVHFNFISMEEPSVHKM